VGDETTLVVEGVGASLELALLREEEDERAGLASIGGRNIKVEDGGDSAVDGTVVLGAVRGVGRGRADRDNQVRVLVVTVDVSWASTGARLGTRRSRRTGCRY